MRTIEEKEIPIRIPLTAQLVKIAPRYRWFGSTLLRFAFGVDKWLIKSKFKITPEDYVFIGFGTSVFLGIVIGGFFLALSFLLGLEKKEIIMYGIPVSFFPTLLAWFNFVTYPKRLVIKRGKEMERRLIYGLRELLLTMKSGATLFDGIKAVAEGDFGGLSLEFQRILRDVKSGVPLARALEESVMRVESKFYKSAIWTILNALRSGVDVSEALANVVDSLVEEQKIAIKEHSQFLNSIILIYMMISVIFPILLVTFMMVIGSLGGIELRAETFYLMWFVIIIANVMFISVIKARRPAVLE